VTLAVRVDAGAAPKGAQVIHFRVADRDDPAVAISEKAKFWMP